MTRRSIASMVLAAMGCGLPAVSLAQSYGPAGQVVTLPPEAGGYGGAYASPSFGDSGGAVTAGYGEVAPAGGYAGPACPPQGYPADCPPQASHGWPFKCRPLFINPKLLKPPRGTYARLEYLLWEIEDPGNIRLGAPVIEDNSAPLQKFAPATDDTTSDGFPLLGGGFGYSPTTGEIQFRDNSGARLTVGIPLQEYATVEASFWALEQASDHYEWEPRTFPNTFTLNPTTTVKVDGITSTATSGLVRIYDTFAADYESDMWGADARFVVDALNPPGEGLKFRPLFGFKYVGLQEALHQRGQIDVGSFSFPTTIDSDTDNTVLGGTIGLRTELEHRWFVVGVEPAVTFAGNISQAKVVTEQFIDPFDPRREWNSDHFDFSPILDLKTYVRVKLSDHLNLHVGYDAFWLARVYRPARVIEYNVATDGSTLTGFQTDFDTKKEADHVAVEGLSVGLEFVF